MEKIIKLFQLAEDGVTGNPFPDKEHKIIINDFEYNSKRMGDAPYITSVVHFPICLDDFWNQNVYAEFNGEKYFVKETPSSKKANESDLYKHDLTLVSERDVLKNVFFYDTVSIYSEGSQEQIVSNGTNVTFTGDVYELAKRIDLSLKCSKIGYSVVVDKGLETEDKFISLKDKNILQALSYIYKQYKIPYDITGKVIHVGLPKNKISIPMEYGFKNPLLAIARNNDKKDIINRILGNGSSDNIPYYYPNLTSKGDVKVLAGKENKAVTTSDIQIVDQVKFAENFPVEKRCEYIENPNRTMFLSAYLLNSGSYKEYQLGSVFRVQTGPMANGNRSISVSFKLTIDVLEDTKLRIGCNFYSSAIDPKNNRYSIRVGNQLNGNIFNDGDVIKKGKNDLFIQVFASSSKNPIRPTYPQRPEDVTAPMFVDAVFDVELNGIYSRKVWAIDGKSVDLERIGLHISESVTPELGDYFTQVMGKIIPFSDVLLPSIYYNTGGLERSYKAENNKYNNEDGVPYQFQNEWSINDQREGIKSFDEIKPSIKFAKNAEGLPIDMFLEFAYDENDNDKFNEVDGNLVWEHPYFFGKLRKTDGPNGMTFNLFKSLNEKQQMIVSMKGGDCGSCEFMIGVGNKTEQNTVQVDETTGELLRDKDGNVRCGREGFPAEAIQEWQQDTSKREVWVALKKDIKTYGKDYPMPSLSKNLKPKAKYYYEGKVKKEREDKDVDRFVILGITLPTAYIRAAEKELEKELIKYMHDNNNEKFGNEISLSRIFVKENEQIFSKLDENAVLDVKYNGKITELFVDSYKYKVNKDEILPEISVTLSKDLIERKNSFRKMIEGLRSEIITVVVPEKMDTYSQKFLKSNGGGPQEVDNLFKAKRGMQFGPFKRGMSGAEIDSFGDAELNSLKVRKKLVVDDVRSTDSVAGSFGYGLVIRKDENTGKYELQIDNLMVRGKSVFSELEIKSSSHTSGDLIVSPAGAECVKVVEAENGYVCYINTTNKEQSINNDFKVDDLVLCRQYNITSGPDIESGNRYYWRRCIETGADYIVLSKTDADPGSNIPMVGDKMVTFGNKTNKERQNVIIISSYSGDAPEIVQYSNVNNYGVREENIVTKISPKGNKFIGDFFLKTGANVGSEIELNKKQIATKVSNKEMQSAIKQEADRINISIKELPIGGENFYSSISKIGLKGTGSQTTGASIVRQDQNGFEILGVPSIVTEAYISTPFYSKGWYNISFYCTSRTNKTYIEVWGVYGNVRKKIGRVELQGQGISTNRQSFTFEVGDDYIDGTPIAFMFTPIGYEYYNFEDVMIEKGSKSSMGWNPSEYDKEQDLLETGIDIQQKEITVTSDRFKVRGKNGETVADFISEDKNGKPVIKAQNLNIDNIEAQNCNFKNGSISGFLTKEPLIITEVNYRDYIQPNLELGGEDLMLSKIGQCIVFHGNIKKYKCVLSLHGYKNTGDTNLNISALKYLDNSIMLINKSSTRILLMGDIVNENNDDAQIIVNPNTICKITCVLIKMEHPTIKDLFYICWKQDFSYKLNAELNLNSI